MRSLLRSRAVFGVVGLVTGAVVGGGIAVAVATQSPSSTVVNACADTHFGDLRLVDDPSECNPRKETPVTWNVEGPAGPQGPEGPQGPQGPEGPQGPAGNLSLAGQQCTPPYTVVGFDAAGDIVCSNPVDADGDGYAGSDPYQTGVTQLDCNDSDPSIHPNAIEIADDGIDQDCNGADLVTLNCEDGNPYTVDTVLDGACTHIIEALDLDGDGWTASSLSAQLPDCNDFDASIHPGATEVVNGVDDDCNGIIDG